MLSLLGCGRWLPRGDRWLQLGGVEILLNKADDTRGHGLRSNENELSSSAVCRILDRVGLRLSVLVLQGR